MLNPLHLRTLMEVVEGGSFAAAARRLGYTSSAVSQQMAILERAVRVTLFERSPHSVRPTAAAELLAALSTDVVAQLGTLSYEVEALSAGRIGRLRLGTFPSASSRLVPLGLAAFVQKYPGISVQLDENEPDELMQALQVGNLDLVLVYRYDLAPRKWPIRLAQTPLLDEDMLLLLPARHQLAVHGPPRLEELARETWVSSNEGTAGEACLHRACAAAGFTPRIALRSNNYGAVQALVAAGMGVALVPALGYETRLGGVKATRLEDFSARRHVTALHRNADGNPALANALAALRDAAAGLEQDIGITVC